MAKFGANNSHVCRIELIASSQRTTASGKRSQSVKMSNAVINLMNIFALIGQMFI